MHWARQLEAGGGVVANDGSRVGNRVQETSLSIEHTWDGVVIPERERANVRFRVNGPEASAPPDGDLAIEVDAPFHDDPAPPGPPGPTDRLWEFEVVELFLVGEDDRYLEIELGPHGHHLVLELHGVRRVIRSRLEIEYATQREADRWRGSARVDPALLPHGLRACNAYAIHGRGSSRRYLAAAPPGGREPDFHRLDCFQRLESRTDPRTVT